jgi:hypothetical protein
LFNSLKNERVHGTSYATRADAQADLFEYIEVFYNRSRRHSTLGYSSPVRFLEDYPLEGEIRRAPHFGPHTKTAGHSLGTKQKATRLGGFRFAANSLI